MEPAQERLKADLVLFEKAIQTLSDAVNQPLTDIVRDAVIQRFEYVFELAWKTIQIAAGYMGIPCNSPRECIKAAYKLGWVKNPDAWFEAMEARNKTSHTYNAEVAQEVYEVARKFLTEAQGLTISLKKI